MYLKKKVLLKDVAEAVGVSVNTVSRALNDHDDISYERKEEIRKKAKELGYIPNAIASSLRSGESKTVGIIFDNITNPYFIVMTEHLYHHFKRYGYRIMIFTEPGEEGLFNTQNFVEIASRKIDGIITFLRPTKKVAELSNRNRVPLVVLGREADDLNIDSIYTNDVLGGSLVGRHFLEKGVKKARYIGAPSSIMASFKRAEGFISVSNNFDKVYIDREETMLEDYVKDAIRDNVEAIFCFNDIIAYRVVSILKREGYNVPSDIKVVGYDNIEDDFHYPTELTSVGASKNLMAQTAVEILLDRISNFDKEVSKVVFDVNLIKRSTV